MKISQLVAHIAIIENLGDGAVGGLNRRAYLYESNGLLELPYKPNGKRLFDFDLKNACAFRLFSVLSDLGFNVDVLSSVAECFAHDLQEAIDAVGKGRDFDLVLTLWHSQTTGSKGLKVVFDGLHEKSDRAKRAVAHLDTVDGVSAQATVRLPVGDLLRALIAVFAEG